MICSNWSEHDEYFKKSLFPAVGTPMHHKTLVNYSYHRASRELYDFAWYVESGYHVSDTGWCIFYVHGDWRGEKGAAAMRKRFQRNRSALETSNWWLLGNWGLSNLLSCYKRCGWPTSLVPGQDPVGPRAGRTRVAEGQLHSLPWRKGLWWAGGGGAGRAVLLGLCYYGNLPLCFPGSGAAASFSDWHQVRQLRDGTRKMRKWRHSTAWANTHAHILAPGSHCQDEFPDLLPLSLEPISSIWLQLLLNNMLGEFLLYSSCHLDHFLARVLLLPAILCSPLPYGGLSVSRARPLTGIPWVPSTFCHCSLAASWAVSTVHKPLTDALCSSVLALSPWLDYKLCEGKEATILAQSAVSWNVPCKWLWMNICEINEEYVKSENVI